MYALSSPLRLPNLTCRLAIALPSQGIAHDAERGVPTTKRKLTLDDLVSHLKHYSAGVRKGVWRSLFLLQGTCLHLSQDAIIGLRELFEDHPDVIVSSLSTTLSNCARIIGDEVSTLILTRMPKLSLIRRMQAFARCCCLSWGGCSPEYPM